MPRAIGIGIGTSFGGGAFTPARLDPVLWLDAGQELQSGAAPQVARNFGSGGSALNATYGSSSGADTNDPTLLTWTGENYLYQPGVTLNWASTPDAAPLDITGDIDLRVDVALDSWSSSQYLLGKAATGQRSYNLVIVSGGFLRLEISNDGTTVINITSTVAVGLSAGQRRWVRGTLDVDNGASGRTATFFTSTDGVTWTTLDTVTSAGTTSLFAGTVGLIIGGNGFGGFEAAGKFYRAQVRNGINGTVVFDADFTTGITTGAQTTFTESSSNAATVTINRSTSGRKSVAVVRPTWLFGTDDYMEIPDNALLDFGASDSATWVVVHRHWNNFGTNDALLAKKANTTAATQGWLLGSGSTAEQIRGQVGDGSDSAEPVTGSRTAGTRTVAAVVLDRAAATAVSYLNTTAGSSVSTTDVGDLSNAEVVRIGRLSGAGTEYSDAEITAVLLFRRALTAAEIGQLVTYYGTA
jgi:hypothetical protein